MWHVTPIGYTHSVRTSPPQGTSKPFLLFYAPHIAHEPLQAPRRYMEMYASVADERRKR